MILAPEKNKITKPYFNDPTNRWLTGLTNKEHHSLPVISSSAVKCFHSESPWVFHQKYVLKNSKKGDYNNDFRIGTLIHLAILEPEKFDKYVGVCDDAANTNKYKEFRVRFLSDLIEKEKPKKEILTATIAEPVKLEPIPFINSNTEIDLDDPKLGNYERAELLSAQIQKNKRKRALRNALAEETLEQKEDRLEKEMIANNKLIPDLVLEPKIEGEEELGSSSHISDTPKRRTRAKAKAKEIEPEMELVTADFNEPRDPVNYETTSNGGYIINANGDEAYIVKSSEMAMFRQIQLNCKNHFRLSLMLPACQHIEQTGVARCPRTGLYLSVRGDARSDEGYFIDPKSIAKISRYNMEYAQAKYFYFLQHAHYIYAANLIEPGKYDRFYFLYISKEPPYEVCVTHLEQDDIDRSNKLYFSILDNIRQCEYNNSWPGLDEGNGLLINIPKWAL